MNTNTATVTTPKVYKMRLVRKSATGEWLVKVHVNGKYSEAETYYTDDKADALDTMEHMKKIVIMRGDSYI